MPPFDIGPFDAITGFQLRPTIRGSIEIEGWQHKTYQWCYALFVTDSPIEWNGRRVRVKGLVSGVQQEVTAQIGAMSAGLSGLPPPRYFFSIQVLSQYPKPGGGDVPTPGTYHDSPCRQFFPWADGEEAVATLLD
ncbi:MAG: hypothetical protein HQL52_12745 [Magnetococcales bacterium]|nr:hypothetical protein [Magnetococcales bacterium]